MMASWTCPDCTYTNERVAAFCGMCAAARPSVSHAPIDLRSPAQGKTEAEDDGIRKAASAAVAGEGAGVGQAEDGAGDEDLPARPAEERRGSNPFSSFVYNDDDDEDDTTVSTAPLRAFAFAHAASTAKRPLSKLLSGGGGNGAESDDGPKKKAKQPQSQQGCGAGAPEDFEKESEDTKEATVFKWKRILGPLAKRTQTGSSNNIQAGGGVSEAEGGETDGGGKNDTTTTTTTTAATDEDPSNLYRFRLLVAVILSSRTQEQIVRQAIEKISTCYPGQQFSPRGFAALESWEELSEKLSFVHCNKVKSRHILQTAGIIMKDFGGKVPLGRLGLLRMAGIGPTLAPLLEFLYARRDAEEEEAEKEGEKEEGDGGEKEEDVVVVGKDKEAVQPEERLEEEPLELEDEQQQQEQQEQQSSNH